MDTNGTKNKERGSIYVIFERGKAHCTLDTPQTPNETPHAPGNVVVTIHCRIKLENVVCIGICVGNLECQLFPFLFHR